MNKNKKNIFPKKYIALILLFCQLFTVVMTILMFKGSVNAENYSSDPMVRIGLLYGSEIVESYQTTSPYGFTFNYVTKANSTTANYLMAVGISGLVVTKDENLAKNSAGRYYQATSNIVIGKYQIEYTSSFSSFASAKQFIVNLKNDKYVNPFIAYSNGKIYVRFGSFTSEKEATNFISSHSGGNSLQIAETSKNAVTVIDPSTNTIVFEFNSSESDFAMQAINSDLSAAEALSPVNNPYPDYLVYRRDGSGIEVINLLSIQNYVKGVLPAEIIPTWHEEALKAFAIVVRTYTIKSINKHSSQGFMLCNKTHCQAYMGMRDTTEKSNKAVDDTKDMVITYNDKPIEAVYHSSSGGITENHNDAWGGTMTHPYLASVQTPFESPSHPNATWKYTVDAKTLTNYLKTTSSFKDRFTPLKGDVAKIVITSRSEAGYVKSVDVYDTLGNKVSIANSDIIRIAFSRYANSANMNIYSDKDTVITTPTEEKEFSHNVNDYGETNIDTSDLNVMTSDGVNTYPTENGISIVSANGTRTEVLSDSETTIITGGTATTFTFEGKGWGHGVGLSQYGTMDLANSGKSYKEIITTYYTGVKIQKLTNMSIK